MEKHKIAVEKLEEERKKQKNTKRDITRNPKKDIYKSNNRNSYNGIFCYSKLFI